MTGCLQEMDLSRWVTVIGRGHSGTRAISHTLSASGVFMGDPLNESGDLLPPRAMYEAARLIATHVRWLGDMRWDFSALHTMNIPARFTELIESYLHSVIDSSAERRGWKIPETTLVYPWIVRLFPEMKYIFWIRNPRDCILGGHITDRLASWGIDHPQGDDVRWQRAISWKYQYDLVRSTPLPKHWIEVRFEDFVLDQARTLGRLEEFLEMPLAPIPVRPESVGRYRTDDGVNYFDFFEPAMRRHGYDIPARAGAGARKAMQHGKDLST